MKKKFTLIILVISFFSLTYAQVNETAPLRNSKVTSPAAKANLLLQFQFNTHDNSGEAGCETDGQFIYTSLWNSDQFLKYDMDGNFIEYFQIAGVSNVRDLAYDGQYFYGSAANTTIYEMDFTNKTLVSSFVAPGAARAIAYDNDLDAFYANNWSSDIILFDRTGLELNRFPIGAFGSYYGFAYDNYSTGGPFLWGYSQDGSGHELVQIELPSGNETGIVYDLEAITGTSYVNSAGGLFIHPGIVPGTVSICGNAQNEQIWGLELAPLAPAEVPLDPIGGIAIFMVLIVGTIVIRKLI